MGPVAGQHVELLEGPLVEEVVDALPGGHLALGVLALDRPLRCRRGGPAPCGRRGRRAARPWCAPWRPGYRTRGALHRRPAGSRRGRRLPGPTPGPARSGCRRRSSGWTKATVVPREPGPGRLVDDPAAVRPSPTGGRPRSRPPGSRRGAGPRPWLRQVLGHRRVVPGRGEQLDVGVGHLEQRLLDPVATRPLAVGDGGPEDLARTRRRRRRGR